MLRKRIFLINFMDRCVATCFIIHVPMLKLWMGYSTFILKTRIWMPMGSITMIKMPTSPPSTEP